MVQEYQEPRLELTLHKFYGRYNDLFSKYNVSSKHLMADVFSFLFNYFLNTVLTTLTWLPQFLCFCYNSVTNVDSKFDNELDRTGCDILRSGGSWWIVVERSRAWWSDVNDEGTWRSIKYIFSYLHVCRWVYCLFFCTYCWYILESMSHQNELLIGGH